MSNPTDLRYSKEHEWVRVEGDEAVIGITDHAQDELGDITFIELPDPEDGFEAGDSVASIESVKAASDVYTPVAGRVLTSNPALEDQPELINQSPYGEGWIVRLALDDGAAEALKQLMDAAAYDAYLEEIAE